MENKLIYLIAILIPLNLSAVQNKFSYITTENGLSQGNITCIYQDSKGFMWFGTYSGLNRYDGYKTKVFNHETDDSLSLSHEHVSKIVEDSEGKLWIGTIGGGVSIYFPEKGNFRKIQKAIVGESIIPLRVISAITRGPDNNMWILEETNGLFVFDSELKLVKSYLPNPENLNSLPNTPLHGVLFDTLGNCWVGSGNGTLCKLNKESDNFRQVIFEHRYAAADDGIKSMYRDKDGRFWIGTVSQGAYMFDPVSEKHINFRKEDPLLHLTGNTVMAFCDDWDGNMLIGIDGGGINILNRSNGAMDHIGYDAGNSESLSTNAVYALYVDKTETLWVGTYGGGINYQGRYRYKFTTYKPKPADANSLSYKNVTSFLEDTDGDIWIGTDGGGLNNFGSHRNSFKRYSANPENPTWLQTDVIIHMMQDSDGEIYLGSYKNGLTVFNPETEVFKQYLPNDSIETSIAGSSPWYIFQDSYGTIWVGLLAVGLDKFDKSTEVFTHYRSNISDPTTLNSPNIKIIYEDSQRNLWIGTEGGGLHLFNRDNETFTRYFYVEGDIGSISNDDVREIYEDKSGRLWIGTSNGLNLMHRDSNDYFEVYTEDDGLPNNVINGILEDDDGYLWMSTNKGICKFHPDKMTFRYYDKSDGLQGNEFNYTASLKSTSGEFYFGGKEGFSVFRPEEIIENPNVPNIVLTDFQIFNKSIDKVKVRKRGRKTYMNISEAEEINISYKDNVIGFEFASLDFGNPGKNQYKYMLEGFDKEWISISSDKRYASYTNLSSGKYVFRVIGSNSDGLWNEEGLSVRLRVRPPFWKRKIFILLSLIILTYLILRYVRERQQKIIRDKKILEDKIREGLEEVEKQKNEALAKTKALEERLSSEEVQNWYNVGMTKMSSVMSQNKDDLQKFSHSIITEVVEYLQVQQGAFYILNDDNENDQYLELMAAYAPDAERLQGNRFELQESQVGACFTGKQEIRVDDLPEGYANITSGLGEATLKYLVIIPIQLNEIAMGVIELISFEKVSDFKVEFIKKAGETITAILTSLKANEQTKRLLEIQKSQAEEMAAHEEELRQNLEEMKATQDELERLKESERVAEEKRRAIEKEFIEKLQVQNEELQAQEEELRQNLEEMQTTQEELIRLKEISDEKQALLEKEEYLFNALLDSANESIYFKDKESRFIRVSRSMVKLFKAEKFKDLVGKSDFDFFDEEHAKPAFDDEQKIIKTGNPIIDLVEKEVQKDGSVSWVSTSKMPLKDKNGKIVGTFGISKDITKDKQLEAEILSTNEQLEFEKIMFAALMDNISARITYKDTEARHIRINKAKSKALGLKDISEIFGKTDPEVFGSTHSIERLQKEIKQIRKGESSQSEELFMQKDGQARWGDTSRIPLKNKKGEIIGGLVITWDITNSKNTQFELEQANDLMKGISKEFPLIMFDTSSKGEILDISGEGLKFLNLKEVNSANIKLYHLFPEIKKSISDKNAKVSYTVSGEVKNNEPAFNYRCLLVKSKSTNGGYSGYIKLERN